MNAALHFFLETVVWNSACLRSKEELGVWERALRNTELFSSVICTPLSPS